jgi:cell wall assembly regulator SMI1
MSASVFVVIMAALGILIMFAVLRTLLRKDTTQQIEKFRDAAVDQETAVVRSVSDAFGEWLDATQPSWRHNDAVLNPPAEQRQIEYAERKVGRRLPKEMRELYGIANGQVSNSVQNPVFGICVFLPLQEVISLYQQGRLIHAQNSPAERAALDSDVLVDTTETVRAQLVNPLWFPFARSAAGVILAFDEDPNDNGSKGQIIVCGWQQPVRYCLGHSLATVLAAASATGVWPNPEKPA